MPRTILIIFGLLVCVSANPRLREPIVQRLINEGLVTPQRVKPEKAELIRFAGPNMSLFIIGAILIIIGIII
jgi:hypothetical protein